MSLGQRMRSKAISIGLSLLIGLTGVFPATAAADTGTGASEGAVQAIFSDSFENLDNWVQHGGSSKAGVSSGAKYDGANSVKLDNTDDIRAMISTEGYADIGFSYYYKTGSNYTGQLSVQYAVYTDEWHELDVINASLGTFTQKQYALPPEAADASGLQLRFVADSGSSAVYIDQLQVVGQATTGTEPTEPTEPEGPVMEIYAETFDDPDNFGSDGGVSVPPPWLQEGNGGKSPAKTSASTTAPSTPNMVKIDSLDSLVLPMNLTGYGNISLSYYTRASSYNTGSIVVEWSGNAGATWSLLEEFKLPEGTKQQSNTQKSWQLGQGANNNADIRIRFRVGETEVMAANMYIDSVVVSGQRIPGIEPAPTPVPIPEPVETPPFVPPAGVIMHEDVEIGMAGNRKIYASIAVPETAPSTPMPVMVYIHGGGWNHGDRKSALQSISNYVTKYGYIGVSLSYRLTPEAPYPAQIQDIKLGIRYLRANAAQYYIDPSRIGVWGSSAGAHLAALLGTTADLTSQQQITLDNGNTVNVPDLEGTGGYPEYSTRVQAVVDWFGPADFTTEFANNYSSVTALLGGHKAFTVPNEARLAMPGTYASPDDPPIWIRHGTADSTVPYQGSEVLNAQLLAAGVPVVDFKLVPGQGHGFVGEAKDTANAEAWAFMDQHVKNRTVTEPILYKPGYQPTNPNPDPDPGTNPGNPEPPKEIVTEIASLLPTDDAAIDSTPANAGTNYDQKTGSSVGLFSIGSDQNKKKYVYYKYDVSEASAPDYKYTLYVSAKTGSTGTPVEMSVFGLDDVAWSETGLTWNNAPVTTLNAAQLLGTFTIEPGSTRLYEVDVTDYVTSKLSQAQGKVAFILGDAGNTGISVNIYSKETTGSTNPKPRLIVKEVIDYSNDTEPPTWPADSKLAASNLGTNFVDLSWPSATDNTVVAHYLVYRDGTFLARVEGNTYKVEGLAHGTAYSFTVEAVDVAGHASVPLLLNRTTLTEPIAPIPVQEVVASGSDGNPEFNTIDNNLYTRWSAAGAGQWVQFDLGELKRLGYIGIAFYKGDVRSTLIKIETSVDGSTWTEQFNGSSIGQTVHLQAFDIPDTDARYVRVSGYGNSDGSLFTSLTEVHMYPPYANGDTPLAVVPNVEPGRPDDAVPFTKPGMRHADGSERPLHTPNAVTGRTLNVLDYGADPADNGTDDRPAIQAAINAAEPGDEVYLPNGVYNLHSAPDSVTNLVLRSGVNLRGESEAGAILKTSLDKVKNSTALKASRQHDIVISDLTLTSTWAGEYSTDHRNNNPSAGGPDSQIVIANFGEEPSYNITIDRVTVEKYIRMGIRIDNSRDVTVRRSTFRNATDVGGGGAGYGVSIQGIAKVDRLGYANDTIWNVVEDSSFEGPYMRHGALIQFVAHNNVIRNNSFHMTKLDAIDLHGELEYLNEIYGNVITDVLTGGGVALGNTGGTAPSNHSKSGPGNYIHDNIIRGSREGINVSMGTPDTVIERNIIENTTGVEGAVGINVLNGPGTIIRGNIIRGNTAPGYWGILLERDPGDQNANNVGAGDPQDVQILRNTITGNTNGIHLQAGSNIVLRGNVLDNLGTNYLKADGVTAIEQESSANAELSSLTASEGTLSPEFAADVTAYTVHVANAVTSLELTFAAADSEAEVQAAGGQAAHEGVYRVSNLPVGATTVTIEVTAENGDKRTYTVTIQRAAPPSGSDYVGGPVGADNNGEGGKLNTDVKTVDGKQVAEARVDDQTMERAIQAATAAAGGSGGIVKLIVEADVSASVTEVSVSLTGGALRKLAESGQTGGKLLVDTQLGTYELPVDQLRLFAWAEQLGVSEDQLNLVLTIAGNAEEADRAAQSGHEVLGAAEFTLTAGRDGNLTEISEFDQYVRRTMELERTAADAGHLAVVRVTYDGDEVVYEPVPFNVDGSTVTIYSRTNSTYLVLQHQATFGDVRSHWARAEIERLANRHIVQGLAPDQFRPDQAITRAEFAALIVRALGLKAGAGMGSAAQGAGFRDVDAQAWYAGQVNAAEEAGIVSGYEDQSFRPDQTISRQEMAAMIYRAMQFAGYASADAGAAHVFADADLIGDWAAEAIRELAVRGIVQGAAPGMFDPAGSATRAHSAAVIGRMLDQLTYSN